MKKILFIICLVTVMGFGCNTESQISIDNTNLSNSNIMKISSAVFENNSAIPDKFTCDGANINPPLNFENVPAGTKSLALLVDDPDAPAGTWTHWLLYNIDPSISSINENSVPSGAMQGTTSFGTAKWGGPCPPSGIHRYFFKLFALDIVLDTNLIINATKFSELINGHIIGNAELIGLYNR